MMDKLLQLYPKAEVAEQPGKMDDSLWLQIDQQFIGIPRESLPANEQMMLQTLFPLMGKDETFPIDQTAEQWQRFLSGNGPLPDTKHSECRFIHYQMTHIQDEFLFEDWEEALKSLFTGDVQLIPFSRHEGVIIEFQKQLALPEHELLSAVQMFESDFFFKIHFFIGHFMKTAPFLQGLYKAEKDWFRKAIGNMPGVRIFTREKVMPYFLRDGLPLDDKQMMFQDIREYLLDDPELKKTVVTYIECLANATSTAKKLFMHRNSLQYRIEKFIEKTGIDIKQFAGALFVYMACLDLDEK